MRRDDSAFFPGQRYGGLEIRADRENRNRRRYRGAVVLAARCRVPIAAAARHRRSNEPPDHPRAARSGDHGAKTRRPHSRAALPCPQARSTPARRSSCRRSPPARRQNPPATDDAADCRAASRRTRQCRERPKGPAAHRRCAVQARSGARCCAAPRPRAPIAAPPCVRIPARPGRATGSITASGFAGRPLRALKRATALLVARIAQQMIAADTANGDDHPVAQSWPARLPMRLCDCRRSGCPAVPGERRPAGCARQRLSVETPIQRIGVFGSAVAAQREAIKRGVRADRRASRGSACSAVRTACN